MNQTSDPDKSPAMVRLRRKLEILRMDLKAAHDHRYHDINECLSLMDIIERTKDRGKPTA